MLFSEVILTSFLSLDKFSAPLRRTRGDLNGFILFSSGGIVRERVLAVTSVTPRTTCVTVAGPR